MYNPLPTNDFFFNPSTSFSLGSNSDNVTNNFEVGGCRGREVLGDVLVYPSEDLDVCVRFKVSKGYGHSASLSGA